jgi:hypothetical protein
MRRTLLALAALLAAHAPAAAQGGPPVRPEQVVRVHAPAAGLRGPTIGTVLDVRADSLFIQTSVRDSILGGSVPRQRAIALRDVWRLEVEAGTRSRTRGALIGTLVGTGVGVGAAALHMKFSIRRSEYLPCEAEPCPFPPESRLEPYPREKFVGITAAGTLLGAAAGTVFSGRRWRHVLPVAPAAGGAPNGGMQVSGTVRF